MNAASARLPVDVVELFDVIFVELVGSPFILDAMDGEDPDQHGVARGDGPAVRSHSASPRMERTFGWSAEVEGPVSRSAWGRRSSAAIAAVIVDDRYAPIVVRLSAGRRFGLLPCLLPRGAAKMMSY
jgi:hypothetical protein